MLVDSSKQRANSSMGVDIQSGVDCLVSPLLVGEEKRISTRYMSSRKKPDVRCMYQPRHQPLVSERTLARAKYLK